MENVFQWKKHDVIQLKKRLCNLLRLEENRSNQLYQEFVWIDVYLMSIWIQILTEMRHISNKCCNTILLRILDKFIDMKNVFYEPESC